MFADRFTDGLTDLLECGLVYDAVMSRDPQAEVNDHCRKQNTHEKAEYLSEQ